MASSLVYPLVGMCVCFIGTIPFGPINLAVVKTTVDHNYKQGLEVAVAASLVEIAEALIAITFGMMIGEFIATNAAFKFGIAVAFILLALFVYTRKSDPELNTSANAERSFFLRGLILATLNPQAIPFWIFALAALSQYVALEYSGINLVGFLLGVFVGKLAALGGFVVASNYLKSHLQQSSKRVNQAVAAILLLIGVSQLWLAVSS